LRGEIIIFGSPMLGGGPRSILLILIGSLIEERFVPVRCKAGGRLAGFRTDAALPVIPVLPVVAAPGGLSFSGGGVGGNMFLFMAGGALCSLPPRLVRPGCTRFEAA
jgi:hypothetical protein